MAATTIVLDMDRACSQCGEKGATPGGLCLKCAGEMVLRRIERETMDAVLLIDQTDATRLYQQAKAVEAQRALFDLKSMTEDEDDEVMAQAKKSLMQVHALVGLLLCSRLKVRKPVPRPQGELEFEKAPETLPADTATGISAADEVVRKMNLR